MNSDPDAPKDLATAVLQRFLRDAKEKGIAAGAITRLQRVLESNSRPTKKDLEEALFAEEALP